MDIKETEAHRVALMGHCYRMLGSALEAGDAVQETMLRAWRGAEGFAGRSSLRTWLYRIATNVCLDTLADRPRRVRPIDDGPAGGVEDPIEQYSASHWIEPIPTAHRGIGLVCGRGRGNPWAPRWHLSIALCKGPALLWATAD